MTDSDRKVQALFMENDRRLHGEVPSLCEEEVHMNERLAREADAVADQREKADAAGADDAAGDSAKGGTQGEQYPCSGCGAFFCITDLTRCTACRAAMYCGAQWYVRDAYSSTPPNNLSDSCAPNTPVAR